MILLSKIFKEFDFIPQALTLTGAKMYIFSLSGRSTCAKLEEEG